MNSEVIQSAVVDAALTLVPPRLRRSLLNDKAFTKRFDISTVTRVTLQGGPSFRRDQLYDAIRNSIRRPGVTVSVDDYDSVVWVVIAQLQDDTFAFFLSTGDKRYALTDHSALSDDPAVRVAWFERTANEINLDGLTHQKWLLRLRDTPLSDDEFAQLVIDIEQTPVSTYRNLQASMEHPRADLATLVPHELRYYERLVGQLGSAPTAEEFIETSAKHLVADLQLRGGIQGFLYALLTCSIGQIADLIQIKDLSRTELVDTYEWLSKHGDPISQIGAVEVALSHLDTHPELAPFVERIVEIAVADDPALDRSSFALLSSIIIVVASELSRKRSLAEAPPYYRTHAAIAQASLIVRAINESRIDPASVTQWAQQLGVGHIFFLQGLIDLRREPRWLPDFMGPDQLRAEFSGRIAHAAARNDAKIQIDSLRALLLGQNSRLVTAASWPSLYLPGPLEGSLLPTRAIPGDVLTDIRTALEGDRLEANSFAGLINTVLLFDLPEGLSSLAADALHRVDFSVDNAEDEATSFRLMSGLAVVAAATRSNDLANALRILTRVIRRRKRFTADLDTEMRIAMIAAASFENLDDWARFAGEWITEIAFETDDTVAAADFLIKLRRLVKIEPALARHCAAADAALAAFDHRCNQ